MDQNTTTDYSPTQNAGQPDAAAQPGAEQTTAPAFTMPEKFAGKTAEDIARSYVELESQHGKYATTLKDLEGVGGVEVAKQWVQYGPQLYQAYQRLAEQIAASHGQQSPAPVQQGPAVDPYEDWEMLTPKEQAQRQMQVLANAATQYINAYGTQIAQAYQQQIAAAKQELNTQWDIYRKVMGQWQKNPNIDPEALLQSMARVATGDVNSLMDIASKQITGEADLQARIDAEVQRRMADARLKAQNAQLNTLSSSGHATFQSPRTSPATGEAADAALMKYLLEQGIVTPSHF